MESEELKLLGKLDGQVELLLTGQVDQKASIGKLFQNFNELKGLVLQLPCKEEDRRIKQAEEDITNLQGCISSEGITNRSEKLKGNISLRNLIVAIILTAICTTGLNVILNLVFTGKP